MQVDKHFIVIADCLEHMRTMEDQTVDCCVTSPPYNLNIDYNTYEDKKPRDAYLQWMRDVGIELFRVLKPNGSYFLNIGGTNIDPWIAWDVAQVLRDVFVLQNHIVWVKSISIGEDTVGHFKPITSKRFLNYNHENIFHFTKNGDVPVDRLAIGVPFKDKNNIGRRNHTQDKRCAGNIWYIPYETVQSKNEKYNHPAIFPIELPTRCLKMTGIENGIVLDPFLGSGTTLIAANRLGWSSIGIDIDEKYIEIANNRLNEFKISELISV